jgi:hypothetical protein
MEEVRAARLVAMRNLAIDAGTGRILGALEAAGIRSILLKGPTLQRELHRDGTLRPYSDTDLLVAPADLDRAAPILARLGFELSLDHREHTAISEPHAQEWQQGEGGQKLDLHWRVAGIGLAAERAWEILSARTEPIAVGGATAEALARPGIALLVALHAAHHGESFAPPLRDLGRALDAFDAETWRAAARLAAELDAVEALAAGLRLAPAGARLAAELELPEVLSARRKLMASTQPAGSLGVLRILDLPPGRGRRRALREELFPATDLMRKAFPLARRGPLGLALSYCARAAIRAWQLPAAIRAARRARRP